jgi:hypothetical protein
MTTLDAIPWYRSPVMISQVVSFISALTAIAPKLTNAVGLTSPDAITQTVTAVFGVITLVSTTYGAVKRARSTIQPITLTQAAADVHPQTLANAPPAATPRSQ